MKDFALTQREGGAIMRISNKEAEPMRKRMLAMLLAVLTVLPLAGCGGTEDVPSPEKTEEQQTVVQEQEREAESAPAPEKENEPVVDVPGGTNPLTGLPIEPEYENDRPVAVMFNNLAVALPQLGISKADIIYEIPAEGAVTRMVGVFQTLDGVGELGSIRSTRSYYLEVALGHDAVLVHAGGSPEAYENIPAWDVDNIDGVRGAASQTVFWRDAERKKTKGYEHSLLTSGERVLEYLGKGKYRTEHEEGYSYPQAFSADTVLENGTAAETVTLYFTRYKTGVFEYDADTNQYMVSQYKEAYVDGSTGEQVAVTNVLMLETDISVIPGDTEGRLKVRMTGEGEGTYFCGGKYISIRWSKADRNSPFVYTLADGTPLTMAKGTSYVCILDPDNSTIQIG